MLHGEKIELRLVRESDLGTLYEMLTNLDTRGSYVPLCVMSEPTLLAEFNKKGFWDQEEVLANRTYFGDAGGVES